MAEFATSPVIGVNLNTYDLSPAASGATIDNPSVAKAKLGTLVEGTDGTRWIRLLNGAAPIPQGGVVSWTYSTTPAADMIASPLTTALAAGEQGQQLGVAPIAVPANAYFWAQVAGPAANILALAGSAANVALISTTTPGAVTNGTTSGTRNLPGIVLSAAPNATTLLAPGWLNAPAVGTGN